MKRKHRQDTADRRHFTFSQKMSKSIRPKFVYSGHSVKSAGYLDIEHRHELCEILFVIRGQGRVLVNRKAYSVREGDIIVYNAGTSHVEYAEPKAPFETFFCAADGFRLGELPPQHLLPEDACPVRPTGPECEFLRELFSRLIRETEAKDLYHKEIAEDLLKIIFHLVLRISQPDWRDVNVLFSEVKRFLDAHAEETLSLDALAARFYVSKSYLSHIFREIAGISPMRYFALRKLERARELLSDSDHSVAEISERCGFNDPCYFIRAFKRAFGMTPAACRKAFRSAAVSPSGAPEPEGQF